MASILKVNTIQDATNSNTALSIDSSGRVTTPARPSFFVRGFGSNTTDFTTGGESATVNGVTPSSFQLMYNFDDVYHNTGNHFNNASGRFTCPVAGLYLVTCHNGYESATNHLGLGLFLSSNAKTNLADLFVWSESNNRHAGSTLVAHIEATVGQQFLMAYKDGYAGPVSSSGSEPYVSFGATFLG
jgi:hypothetical protein